MTYKLYYLYYIKSYIYIYMYMTSLVAQMAKHLLIVWETWVWSLGQEDPLEKEMAIHSSILAWKIPWMEEPGGLQSMGSQRVRHDWVTSLSLIYIVSIPYNTKGMRLLMYYERSPLAFILVFFLFVYYLSLLLFSSNMSTDPNNSQNTL